LRKVFAGVLQSFHEGGKVYCVYRSAGYLLRYGMPDRANGTDHRSGDLAESSQIASSPYFSNLGSLSPTQFTH
jgi:hypothetical protein